MALFEVYNDLTKSTQPMSCRCLDVIFAPFQFPLLIYKLLKVISFPRMRIDFN